MRWHACWESEPMDRISLSLVALALADCTSTYHAFFDTSYR